MQLTLFMKQVNMEQGPADGSFLLNLHKFLDLDLTEEDQTLLIDFLTKSMAVNDEFLPEQPNPVMTNLRVYYNVDNPKVAITMLGFTDPTYYETVFTASTEYQELVPVLNQMYQRFSIIVEDSKTTTIDVEWFDESKVYLGIPMNWLEAEELFNSAA